LIGAVFAIAGLVGLVWTQLDLPFPFSDGAPISASHRWQLATGDLLVTGVGVLIYVAAEILDALTRKPVRPRTEAEVEELWDTWSHDDASS
jgi:hypothetical protein